MSRCVQEVTVQLAAVCWAVGVLAALHLQDVPPHWLFSIRVNERMIVMFGPPTTTLHCQPVLAASTDCVSIADRRFVCVMCTQLHSCWRTMEGWWFQWLRWLLVSVRIGSCLLCVGVFMRGAEWFCLCPVWSPSSFSLFAPRSLSKLFLLLNEVTAAYAYAVSYRKLCFLSGDGIDREFTWLFDSLNMTSSLDWWWWWFPETPCSDYVSWEFGFLPLVSMAAGLNVQGCSCGHVITSHAICLWCHSLILRH